MCVFARNSRYSGRVIVKRRHVDYMNEDNPFYLGARSLCYEPPVDPPAPCVRDIHLIRQHKVVELYENALGDRTVSAK